MRAISSPLPLLVALVLAYDEHHPVTADDLAFLAHRLDRRSYLHDPFRRLASRDRALAAARAAATQPETRPCAPAGRIRAGRPMVATPASYPGPPSAGPEGHPCASRQAPLRAGRGRRSARQRGRLSADSHAPPSADSHAPPSADSHAPPSADSHAPP